MRIEDRWAAVRRAEAAVRGEVVDQYEGGYAGRDADIEAGSVRAMREAEPARSVGQKRGELVGPFDEADPVAVEIFVESDLERLTASHGQSSQGARLPINDNGIMAFDIRDDVLEQVAFESITLLGARG